MARSASWSDPQLLRRRAKRDAVHRELTSTCRPLLPYLIFLSLQSTALLVEGFDGPSGFCTPSSPHLTGGWYTRSQRSYTVAASSLLRPRTEPPVLVQPLWLSNAVRSKFRRNCPPLPSEMSSNGGPATLSVDISQLVDPAYARTLAIICCRCVLLPLQL